MKGTLTSTGTEVGPFYPTDPGNHWQKQAWHAYISGTFGGMSVQLEYTPDNELTADASSRWFSPTILSWTTQSDQWFEARARGFRFIGSGATAGTASVIVEIV